jgi:type IV pilus assembly protein PilC
MNYDEFAFFNQQLAAMLREGIPLEGALKRLSIDMRAGPLRRELQELETDLARGTPLPEALSKRQLPDLYRRMLVIGIRSNDLPGVLTVLADHYQQANALWTRLKGLMVYPVILVAVSLGLTLVLSMVFGKFLATFFDEVGSPGLVIGMMWLPPIVLGCAIILGITAISIPSWRERLRWRLPAFREASLAQLASAMALMIKNGTTLPEALSMAESLESTTPARAALAQWRSAIEAGQGKPAQWHASAKPLPPLFLWLVQKSGEDLATGFQKAAEIYRGRASYRIELALYGALPVSILFLGQMVLWQVLPLCRSLVWMMNMVGDVGG